VVLDPAWDPAPQQEAQETRKTAEAAGRCGYAKSRAVGVAPEVSAPAHTLTAWLRTSTQTAPDRGAASAPPTL
jgi:hypothetical protein